MKFIAIICLLMVFILADFMVFKSGADSFFWRYKTEPEKELQRRIIEGYEQKKQVKLQKLTQGEVNDVPKSKT